MCVCECMSTCYLICKQYKISKYIITTSAQTITIAVIVLPARTVTTAVAVLTGRFHRASRGLRLTVHLAVFCSTLRSNCKCHRLQG